MTVKTRFAPSPTGFLHIGGVRTALFSWLYARHHGGQFVLRVEDTDRERSTQAAVEVILEGLDWLGLDFDEGPYYQSQRYDRYAEVADRLLRAGQAYHCYCTRDELEVRRAAQMSRGESPRYDGRCRDRAAPAPGVQPVLRFRTPDSGITVVEDLVRGRVEFQNAELDDLILVRSDGTPTFHFGVVVDDGDMGITHVIRGDDHLNNTPRQMHMIQALGLPVPAYGHLPMILGSDGAKLSKRHGAVNVLEYRDEGFLPDAVLNYLVRLGWSHGDQEVFSREEMIRLFDISAVNASASRFDGEKLKWLNQQYLKTVEPESLASEFCRQLQRAGLNSAHGPSPAAVIEAYRERATTLRDLAESAAYLYADLPLIDDAVARKHLTPAIGGPLALLAMRLGELVAWTRAGIHDVVAAVAADCGIGFGKLGQPVRVAVTGGTVSPPIDVTLELLGREKVLQRLKQALSLTGSGTVA
ncbi:MAG: glutamate--tRNA ligase [Gammaproteobacteria bacterium]|nr:glutamate--tRNA ligase [Gammaproteobacteria bacterium]